MPVRAIISTNCNGFPRQTRWLALFAFLVASGCGPATARVVGTVRYQGKPVCSGTIMLLPEGGSPIYADLKDNGEFAASAVPVGKVCVTVSSPDPARPILVKGEAKAKLQRPPDPRWFPLPTKFSDPANSGLKYEVARSPNAWEVDLKD